MGCFVFRTNSWKTHTLFRTRRFLIYFFLNSYMENKPLPGKSRPIPLRLSAENDAYVSRLKVAREYSSMNLTINRIIENHRTGFEVYRLRAKATAKELRGKGPKSLHSEETSFTGSNRKIDFTEEYESFSRFFFFFTLL